MSLTSDLPRRTDPVGAMRCHRVVAADGCRYALEMVQPDGFFEGTMEDREADVWSIAGR